MTEPHWSITALILWDFAADRIEPPERTQERLNHVKALARFATALCLAVHREKPWSDWYWWLVRHFEHRLKELQPDFEGLSIMEADHD